MDVAAIDSMNKLTYAHINIQAKDYEPTSWLRVCPAEPPQVTVELQQQEVVYGETVRFTCQARGKPTPSVMWLHNARPLAPSPRHRLTSRVLRVSNVGPQDDGLYQCMAENGVGSSQASARLITVSTGKSDSCSFVRGLILSFHGLFLIS